MKILLVDDNFVSRKLLCSLLAGVGNSDMAANGQEAILAFTSAHSSGEPYDLICLDILMPEMDGNEVLVKIREWEQHNGIDSSHGAKIIMITAMDDKKNVFTAFNQGCEAYIVKPVEKSKLLGAVSKLGF
jgi:two-component system chemotaxis response regulator CheY